MTGQVPAALESARDQAVRLLSQHYAYDRLTLAEVEKRLESAYAARSTAELEPLLADLPAVSDEQLTTGERPFYQLAPTGEGKESSSLVSIFAEVKRRGSWLPSRRLDANIVFGSMLLDMREARLQPGVTEIDGNVIFGELKVIVPPGVRVVSDGNAIFGSFDHAAPDWDELPPDAPTVRVGGSAFFGSVNVIVRLPGETAIAALRRRWGV